MGKKNTEIKVTAFPTRSGTYRAWEIEALEDRLGRDPEWVKQYPVLAADQPGVPNRNIMNVGINELSMLSYEQAQALAWWFVAERARDPKMLKVRIVPSGVTYQIEAFRDENAAEMIYDPIR